MAIVSYSADGEDPTQATLLPPPTAEDSVPGGLRPGASVPGVWMGTVGHGRCETGDHQPDPHGAIERFGGSFPSGHIIIIIVCSNLAVLLCCLEVGGGSGWLPLLAAFS